jgi:hypothetical protein
MENLQEEKRIPQGKEAWGGGEVRRRECRMLNVEYEMFKAKSGKAILAWGIGIWERQDIECSMLNFEF